jgi:tetratricopeptide (TPR) repeat protein
MHRRPRVAAVFSLGLALASSAGAASAEFTAAETLFKARRYPEAAAALEKVAAAEPGNAAACHYLGLALKRGNDPAAMERALVWLAKAVELEPGNAAYLADFGGTSLELASRTRSYSAATRGRDAMEKALTMDAGNLDAREGLFQFYTRAPWPLGSSAKAAAQLAEIRKHDPDRGAVLAVIAKADAKDYAGAFALCDTVLAKNPDHYVACYQYGRTAAICGQNLERALASLQKCLAQEPPSPASPSHSNVWQKIGHIEEQLKHPAEARAAYETALRLDATNQPARDALAKLK